ncbi:hypothetical protein NQO50_004358 [Vibrio vulnificus]|uniref:hypothetical protein n=1 Tax=Vibrio vulnificus TaxID=672 RepID=UPI00063DD7EA|nr:hypothetical protein [Vibrio vulnificus]EIU7748435.1 hypothetical protein [Vibrio vulnificus]EJN6717966.1 hypothetical protein [Vibrio vulnificus]EJQ9994208.1 hypothetical protein [Vibrio vulnificus]EJV9416031.1 hypothetical protein [Vibrio vulnificus]EKY4883172.1 hypothetical protein [Vibrio vulnificus]
MVLSLFSSFKFYVYLLIVLLVSGTITYLTYTLYQTEKTLSGYKEENAHLKANNAMLKGNLETTKNALESTKLQYKNYMDLHSFANEEVVDLRSKNRELDKQVIASEKQIADIKKELSVAEEKLLEYQVPSALVDTYNADSMYNNIATP